MQIDGEINELRVFRHQRLNTRIAQKLQRQPQAHTQGRVGIIHTDTDIHTETHTDTVKYLLSVFLEVKCDRSASSKGVSSRILADGEDLLSA